MSEWISVKDQLPKHAGVYLTWSEGCLVVKNIRLQEFIGVSSLWKGRGFWADLTGTVTHWMPLPEPPES